MSVESEESSHSCYCAASFLHIRKFQALVCKQPKTHTDSLTQVNKVDLDVCSEPITRLLSVFTLCHRLRVFEMTQVYCELRSNFTESQVESHISRAESSFNTAFKLEHAAAIRWQKVKVKPQSVSAGLESVCSSLSTVGAENSRHKNVLRNNNKQKVIISTQTNQYHLKKIIIIPLGFVEQLWR